MWLSAYVIPSISPKSTHSSLLILWKSLNNFQSPQSGLTFQCICPFSHMYSMSSISSCVGIGARLKTLSVLALGALWTSHCEVSTATCGATENRNYLHLSNYTGHLLRSVFSVGYPLSFFLLLAVGCLRNP